MKDILKAYIRDINLSMITDDYDVKYDVTKRKSKFQFLKKNWNLIKYVTEMGGVLTGSRALKCCTINGRVMLDRNVDDFDFIITKKMAFQICDHFKIVYNLTDNFISVKKQRWTSYHSYSDPTRVGSVDVHLIIKDELPDYIEQNGVRISPFTDIINAKYKFIEDGKEKDTIKHQEDLSFISMKFNLIK
jgi:hypothetical protein